VKGPELKKKVATLSGGQMCDSRKPEIRRRCLRSDIRYDRGGTWEDMSFLVDSA